MSGQVSLQADVGQIPTSALGLLEAAQPLLKALSADNINPLAVIQIQAIGNCFHSNGDWAKRLPDLLSRTSSYRLERLSTWIGWQKGDTGDYLGKTSGGRSAALICLALANLYELEKCGEILYSLSAALLPKDCCNAGIIHLKDISAYLSSKLSTLGYGNHLAVHLSRIRQSFFEAGSEVPLNLASLPTQETMIDFLVNLNKVLQDDQLVLRFDGTHGAGMLLAVVMCLCPEDVRVEVQGELIHQGLRESIVFSIRELDTEVASLRLESRLQIHSDSFHRQYIRTTDLPLWNRLSFTWTGWLSASVSIALVNIGTKGDQSVELAVANFIKTCLYATMSEDHGWFQNTQMPINGIQSWLGPQWQQTISETLKTILVEPEDSSDHNIVSAYQNLRATVASVSPARSDVCDCCCLQEPWNVVLRKSVHPRPEYSSCRYALFWRTLAQLINIGLCSVLVECHGNPSIRPLDPIFDADCPFNYILHELERAKIISETYREVISPDVFHVALLSLVVHKDRYDTDDTICASSEASTIFPMALQYPSLSEQSRVIYVLADGKLYDGGNTFNGITCPRIRPRPKTSKSLELTRLPSSLGVHNRLDMTIHPQLTEADGSRLVLRTFVHSTATKSLEVKFLDIFLGFMGLSMADDCDHPKRSMISDENVIFTSVDAPLAEKETQIAVTLTHWNSEAQFLCCVKYPRALYQAKCCLPCALMQARRRNIKLVIAGEC